MILFITFDSKLKTTFMASIRRLKKDVDYLTAAVVSDCLTFNSRAAEVDPEVATIVQDMLRFRAEARTRITAGRKVSGRKERHAHYKQIITDALSTVDTHFSKLSELIKKA